MPEPKDKFPWWMFVIVIGGASLMILGGVIAIVNPAMLVAKGDVINGAVRIYAGYLVSRNLAIGALLLGALIIRARASLSALLLLAGIVQLLDAVLDLIEGRWTLVPGVLLLGIGFLLAATRASR